MKKFTKLQSKDDIVNRVQDSISTLFDYVQASPLVGEVSIVEVQLSASPTAVSHRLGRTPIGFIVIDINAAAVPFRVSPFTLLSVELQSSSPCKAKILFF